MKRKNTVAKILQGYAWLNGIAGAVVAIATVKSAGGVAAILIFALIFVASFFIYALGEIIELLNKICINSTAEPKRETTSANDLPEL